MARGRRQRRGGRDRNVDWVVSEVGYDAQAALDVEANTIVAIPLMQPLVSVSPGMVTQPQNERTLVTVRGSMHYVQSLNGGALQSGLFIARITSWMYDPASGNLVPPSANYTLIDPLSADDHFLWQEAKWVPFGGLFISGQSTFFDLPIEVSVQRRYEPLMVPVLCWTQANGTIADGQILGVVRVIVRSLVRTVS